MLRVLVTLAAIPVAIVLVLYARSCHQLSQPCETTVNINAAEYWSWVKTFRAVAVKQERSLIRGRLADAPQTCWQIESSVANNDDEGRAEGYRRALAFHIRRVQGGEVMGTSGKMVAELTGIKFQDKKDAVVWAYQNMDHLVYSKEKNILVVDETARGSIYARSDINGLVIPPREYWYMEGLRLVTSWHDEDGYRIVEGTRRSYGKPDEQVEVRVELAKLNDPDAKLDGYKRGLEELARGLRPADEGLNSDILGSLRDLTGRNFSTASEWREWYYKNARSKWVLTSDGNHLAPEKESY